jgi:hypothetical protein
LHQKKRKALEEIRPHDKFWNFFEDCRNEEKVPHLLRYNADPKKAYIDGRIEHIL